MTTHVTFSAVLRALELRNVRLDAGPRGRGPAFAFAYAGPNAGPNGELRDQAWAVCPVCSLYGLRVERRHDGQALVSCRQRCRPQWILTALASAVAERAAA